MAQQSQKNQEKTQFLAVLQEAREHANDLERHVREESLQNHISPVDMAFFSRLTFFLRYGLAEDLTGDPEAFMD